MSSMIVAMTATSTNGTRGKSVISIRAPSVLSHASMARPKTVKAAKAPHAMVQEDAAGDSRSMRESRWGPPHSSS
jgi:hypothetical protein